MSTHIVSGENFSVEVQQGETLLTAMLRQGVSTPFSCRGGTCQTCLLRCAAGIVPSVAQRGLYDELIEKSYFLPCICEPVSAMTVESPRPEDLRTVCDIEAIQENEHGIEFTLEPHRQIVVERDALYQLITLDGLNLQARVTLTPQEDFYLGLRIISALDTAQVGQLLSAQGSVTVHPTPSASATTSANLPTTNVTSTETPDPPTDTALWTALGNDKVRQILDAFYTKVYADPQLAPFFTGVTKEHVAGKQFSFMWRMMTGEKVYFGDTPKNAHHWMVISNELFDHRQMLMEDTLREHGLTEDQISRWSGFETVYRPDIVKSQAIPKMLWGRTFPLDGFAEETLSAGSLCDFCSAVLEPGDRVRYHLRLGTISCQSCSTPASELHPHTSA